MTKLPGEVRHEKARSANKRFAACLQKIVKGFRAEYFVETHAEKVAVEIPGDRNFSFDIKGRLKSIEFDCDVWIEAKGYEAASDLAAHYRNFVRHVALTRLHSASRRRDQFWFVSSSPFACREGSQIGTARWMRDVILNAGHSNVTIQSSEVSIIEQNGFEGLARSIRVLFLTRALMKTTGFKQIAQDGDSIWSLTRDLYEGDVPPEFGTYVRQVVDINKLANPDLIQVDQGVEFPFMDALADEYTDLDSVSKSSSAPSKSISSPG